MVRTDGGGLPCFPSSMKHVKTMTLSYGLGAVEIRPFYLAISMETDCVAN